MRPIKVLTILGTRPEAIKLGPVVKKLKTDSRFESKVCFTSQHSQMLKQVAVSFGIEADYDLQLMTESQTLHDLTSKVLLATRVVIEREKPDVLVVQGDTTTAFASSLSAFYLRVPVAHVEAGLRTGDLYAPFPEEANRILLSRLAAIHFCPTNESRTNLLREGVADDRTIVTGNTVIDALRMVVARVSKADPSRLFRGFPEAFRSAIDCRRKLILVTGHRREHFGLKLRSICEGIRRVAQRLPEISIIYPVHPNPNVASTVRHMLAGIGNIHLTEPLDYEAFVYLLNRAYLVLTDSGGIQEEAPALGKPVLVTRESTERSEAVIAGCATLVGSDAKRIENECVRLINDDQAYLRMAQVSEVFGDGKASERITQTLFALLSQGKGKQLGPLANMELVS